VSESSNEMLPESHEDTATKKEHVSNSTTASINSHEGEQNPSSETACSEERLLDSILLVCCEDSLHLYSTKSVIQVLYFPSLF
jgi:syntaxin-binding protein 5